MADRYLALGIEATPGTEVEAQRYIRLINGDLPGEQGWIYPETADSRGIVKPILAHYINKGGWSQYLSPENFGEILTCGVGSPTTTQPDVADAPSVFDHSFKPLNVLQLLTSRIGKDLMEQGYLATAIKSFELNASAKALVEATVEAYAKKDFKDTLAPSPVFPPSDWFSFNQVTPKIDDVANTLIKAMTFRVENAWDEENFTLGSRYIERNVLEALKVTGRMDIQFANLEMMEYFWGKSGATGPIDTGCEAEFNSLKLEMLGCIINPGETNELNGFLNIEIPKVTWDKGDAKIDKRTNTIQNMTYTAHYDETMESWFEIINRNTIDSYGPA